MSSNKNRRTAFYLGIILLSVMFAPASTCAQVSGISLSAFGDRHWKAPVSTYSALPLTSNLITDTRRCIDTGKVYWWSGSAWILESTSSSGSTIRNSVGVPSSGIGNDGDFNIDVLNWNIYGPKTSGSWGFGVSLIGPSGTNGTNGMNGTNGTNGSNGATATIAIGSTTTGAPGSSASVTNSGNSSAAMFNFTIPRGDVGATGSTGATGATGPAGVISATSPLSLSSSVLSIGSFPSGSGASSLGLKIGASSGFWEVTNGDFLLSTAGKNIAEFNYGGFLTAIFQTLQVPNLKLDQVQVPPYTCDASHAGYMYFDVNSSSFCGCTGVAWLPMLGPGPCV